MLNEVSKPWVGIIEGKIVAKEKSFKDLLKTLKKNYPDKKPLITSITSCETLIL
ncbi:MAG: DUF5678 domain-containing protein [Thaumarchaeota archaeon]|nr:DUF5678 domain-containing protein [Nitrososphaerota archaeon]